MVGSGPQDTHGELLARLAVVGLDEKDAALYAQLCVRGPTKASELASATRLNRTETYRALDSLMRRGFVTASLERPTLYEAASPEKVFDDALAAHVARRASIERAKEATLALLQQIRRHEAVPLRASHKLIQGRPAIYQAVEAMTRRARHEQVSVSTTIAPANATHENSLFQTAIERAKDGLRLRLLSRPQQGVDRALQHAFPYPNVELRYFDPGHPMRFTIVDGREVLIWLVTDPSLHLEARDDVAMWTDAPEFVKAQSVLFEALWSSASERPDA